ncbi:nuclear receptor subfamily 2 group C member 2 [Aphelenchoides avenae]|nr:nuclear receptor subfamily 2 group C member 2 [Aphelenchus avenae]
MVPPLDPFPSNSAPNHVDPSPTSSVTWGPCLICGEETLSKNLGALACRACAAFFRRSCTKARQYRCRSSKQCLTAIRRNLHHKTACKYCRLQRCLEIGMKFTPDVAQSDRSVLAQMAAYRHVMQHDRIRTLLRLGWNPKLIGAQTNASSKVAQGTETILVRGMFHRLEPSLRNYIRYDLDINDVSTFFFLYWYLFEHVVTTARNGGHNANRLYWADETKWSVSLDTREEFWRQFPDVGDIRAVARLSLEWNLIALDIARLYATSELDIMETSAIVALLFAHYGAALFESAGKRAEFVSSVFRDLRKHCPEEAFAEQAGKIVQLLSEFQRLTMAMIEMLIAYDLMVIRDDDHIYEGLKAYRQWAAG